MKEDLIWCDCCKQPMEEATEDELTGQLGGMEALNLDDLCGSCSEVLSGVIRDVLMRRGN